VKPAILWLIIAAGVLFLAYTVYQFRRVSSDLNIDPHVAGEIEKAKRR
jgi:hypothetical protein